MEVILLTSEQVQIMLSIVALRFIEVVLSLTIRCSFKRWTHSPKEIVNMPWRKAAHHVLPVMRMPTVSLEEDHL